MLFITHDLNLAASICDRVYVMSGGRIEEHGDARRVLRHPRAAYTQRLVAATPTLVGGSVPDVRHGDERGGADADGVRRVARPITGGARTRSRR